MTPRRMSFAAVVALAFYHAISFGQGPVSDSQITQGIRNVLRADFRLRAEGIEISSVAGRVTLQGRAASFHNRYQAEQLAKRVEGVHSVINLIKVESALQNDDEIAADIRGQLRRNAFVESSEIEVAVDNGIVTLSGQIKNWAQAHEAETVAGQIRGVASVRSDLVYIAANGRSDEDIQQDVKNELERDALLSEVPIDVKVVQGVATLVGDVPSLYHKDTAGEKTRLVASVEAVDNRLEVLPQSPFETAFGLPTDGEIAQFVRVALDRDPRVGTDGISLKVTKGKLLFWGEVSSLFEKQTAERVACNVIGVLSVENQLQVTGENRSDEDIRRDLSAALSSDAVLYQQQVNVAVHDGRVTLSGEVKDFTSKAQAARLAGCIRGVRSLTNETKVAASARLGDAVVTRLVAGRLEANAIVRGVADRIQVQTAGGVVTLSGNVQTWAQRTEAGRAAHFTDGVGSVENQLKVVGR